MENIKKLELLRGITIVAVGVGIGLFTTYLWQALILDGLIIYYIYLRHEWDKEQIKRIFQNKWD